MIDDTIERCQKDYWDNTSTLTTAWNNGCQEGKHEVKLEVARKMLARGYSVEDIAEITCLPFNQIDAMGTGPLCLFVVVNRRLKKN